MVTGLGTELRVARVLLYGAEAGRLEPEIRRHRGLLLVDDAPDVVVCYGGDGTLLHAELAFPGVPKVPVLNSQRGYRCITHPIEEVLTGLSEHRLVRNLYTKIACRVARGGVPMETLVALNEINAHMGRINSAVRFKLWINGQEYEEGREILGDGFLVCTPFGSTAYFSAITKAAFYEGIGLAFKAANERISHMVVPENFKLRLQITRGPAVLAHDSSLNYLDLEAGDEIEVRKHGQGAVILTCDPVQRLDEPF